MGYFGEMVRGARAVVSVGLGASLLLSGAVPTAGAGRPAQDGETVDCSKGMVTGSEFDSPSLTGVAPATEPVTAAQAVALAEPPLDAEGQPTQPTLVELMSAAEAEGIVPTGLEGLISPKRSLWIVTVHAPMMTRGLPGVSVPREVDVYSVVVDACSGQVLTPGIGDPGLAK